MNNTKRRFIVCGIVFTLLLWVSGCGNNGSSDAVDDQSNLVNTGNNETENKDTPLTDAIVPDQKGNKEAAADNPTVATDLKPSEGLEFESNGDGTCSIIGVGICKDKDIVIPVKSPDGDIVTLIGENSFYSLENVDSITLLNYNYEVDKSAFQYGEFTTLNIIGGAPVIKKSAFSSCEDLKSISFSNCNLNTDDYAFYSCGKDANVSFTNCKGVIGKSAFQYGELLNLTITDCEFEIDKSAFSSCEDLASIVFTESTIETKEYAFYSCGNSAEVEVNNCSLSLDDRSFQYSSLSSLAIAGSKVELGQSVFSNCEDLTAVYIECGMVNLGEYAFYSCEDLLKVIICQSTKADNGIKIDDRAFQYCKRLEAVTVGKGAVEVGEYVFSNCADNLEISIAGKKYNAETIKDGLK